MRIKGIVFEDFLNYKKPSMFIITCFCDWKCCHDGNFPETVCQNNKMAKNPINDINNNIIINAYLSNNISKSIVFGGLEPFKQYEELLEFIKEFREKSDDDIVIYTGYYKDEISEKIQELSKYKNIIVKYGRYIPNKENKYDEILGITLASDNQYAEKIS